MNRRIYKKSPLIEALCEVRFAETEGDFTYWGDFYRKIKESYPIKSELPSTFDLQIASNAGANLNVTESLKRFISGDNTQLVQATKDHFTLNRLSPYLGYEEFKKSFVEVLETYTETFSPKRVMKLSMRYVNQIIIPQGKIPLFQYFNLVPMVSEGLTSGIGNMSVQLQIAPQIKNHLLQITLQSSTSPSENNWVFFFDIFDVFLTDTEIKEIDILKVMDEAHANIEHTFEHIIQENLRELFQEEKENG